MHSYKKFKFWKIKKKYIIPWNICKEYLPLKKSKKKFLFAPENYLVLTWLVSLLLSDKVGHRISVPLYKNRKTNVVISRFLVRSRAGRSLIPPNRFKDPDPYQNEIDPKHCFLEWNKITNFVKVQPPPQMKEIVQLYYSIHLSRILFWIKFISWVRTVIKMPVGLKYISEPYPILQNLHMEGNKILVTQKIEH